MRALLAIFSFVLCITAAPVYHVTNLGNFSGQSATAFDINNSGAAAGSGTTATGSGFAAFWPEAAGEMLAVQATADAINNYGAVIGTASVGGRQRATTWSASGSQYLMHGEESYGLGINDSGDTVGGVVIDGKMKAFINRLGTVAEIPTGAAWSAAYDINNHGQVAGYTLDDGSARAFTWRADEGIKWIGPPGAGSYAMALSDSGLVVGSAIRSGYLHAFLYDGFMRDLGTLGGSTSASYGVNSSGNVVGYSYDGFSRQRAFVWFDGMMLDLNHLIEPASGWTLEAAYGINESGQIVGEGTYGGARMAFALNPLQLSDPMLLPDTMMPADVVATPEPGTAFLFGSAFAIYASSAFLWRRRRSR